MTETLVSRRAALVGAAAFCLAGRTARAAASPDGTIRALRVTGRDDGDMVRLVAMVSEELARQLGGRYAPGARGGATLVVELRQLSLSMGNNRRFGGGDSLNGQITLVGAGGAVMASFPLLAASDGVGNTPMFPAPSDARLQRMAAKYAYWIVEKLGG